MHLASIHIYPIKSCGGITVTTWPVDEFGLRYDRRWMLATPRGHFLTQRELPALALVRVSLVPPHLKLIAPGMEELTVALDPLGGRPIAAQVWNDAVQVVAPDHAADAWFSDYLGYEVVLAYMPASVVRPVDSFFAPKGGRASFADGFPFLLAGEASLADLNGRLEVPLPMNRFRPNLVVSGSTPYAEDGWRSITVGAIPMEVVKPCARCVVTTTNQDTLERDQEPLRTLATYRLRDQNVMFGQNVVHYGTGRLRVGDVVTLTDPAE
jgi:hypothetical protein